MHYQLADILTTAAQQITPVHTTGVNWTSVLTIVGGVFGSFLAAVAFLDARQRRRQDDTKNQITEAVTGLSNVLVERLETKENVGQLRVELAHVEEQVRYLSVALTADTAARAREGSSVPGIR
jgi:hypothetical protein